MCVFSGKVYALLCRRVVFLERERRGEWDGYVCERWDVRWVWWDVRWVARDSNLFGVQ